MSETRISTYGAAVGNLWVEIDFEAMAVSVRRTDVEDGIVLTKDMGDGVLIDRSAEGAQPIVAVEWIAGSNHDD